MNLYKITTQYKISKDGEVKRFVKAFFVVAKNAQNATEKLATKAFIEIPTITIEDLQVCTIDEIGYTDLSTSRTSYVK